MFEQMTKEQIDARAKELVSALERIEKHAGALRTQFVALEIPEPGDMRAMMGAFVSVQELSQTVARLRFAVTDFERSFLQLEDE